MHLYSENKSITFETVQLQGGFACYVSGRGDRLAYRAVVPDTADYLAIENHSPFWCRPFWGQSLTELPQRVQALLIRRGNPTPTGSPSATKPTRP